MQTSFVNAEMNAEYTRQRLMELRQDCRQVDARLAFDRGADWRQRIGSRLIALGQQLGGQTEPSAPLQHRPAPTS